jgi:hypothetical protein
MSNDSFLVPSAFEKSGSRVFICLGCEEARLERIQEGRIRRPGEIVFRVDFYGLGLKLINPLEGFFFSKSFARESEFCGLLVVSLNLVKKCVCVCVCVDAYVWIPSTLDFSWKGGYHHQMDTQGAFDTRSPHWRGKKPKYLFLRKSQFKPKMHLLSVFTVSFRASQKLPFFGRLQAKTCSNPHHPTPTPEWCSVG